MKEKILEWFLKGIWKAIKQGRLNVRSRVALWVAQRTVDRMKGSWKTTAAGVCAILVAVATAVRALVDGDPTTNINFEATITAISAGVGLIVARDNDKSSEEVGVK